MQHAAFPFVERASPAIMPWSLRAWPPLLWQAAGGAPTEFHHLSTRVDEDSGGLHCRASGQTIWAGTVAGCEAGMAWDWIEVAHGVLAMADPMSVITNLRFLGSAGEVLTAAEAALVLNGIVHALPWQDEVGRALATRH
ncbi:MAG TPA: hypothetical protein PKO45_02310 [Rubrivivax sp.]|nr:hypothetical protein [Burkholderiales bacterium]HNT37931.1 hypothetical protein [Rubrivivax sp.]